MSQPNSVSENACCDAEGKTTITLNITVGSGCDAAAVASAGGASSSGRQSPVVNGSTASPQVGVGGSSSTVNGGGIGSGPSIGGYGGSGGMSGGYQEQSLVGTSQGNSQQTAPGGSYVEPAQVQGSVAMRDQSGSRSAKDPNTAAKIVSMAQQRVSMGALDVKDIGTPKMYHKIDEVAENEDIQKGLEPAPSLYCQTTSRVSRYSKMYNDNGETPLERSFKITSSAREDINKMHKILESFFDMLLTALEALPKKDFSICDDMLGLICQVQSTLVDLIEHLRYGPYKHELEEINDRLIAMIDELEVSPPFVLLRLVEFGFNIYELGNRLREELLPSSFAHLVHKVQSRIYVSCLNVY